MACALAGPRRAWIRRRLRVLLACLWLGLGFGVDGRPPKAGSVDWIGSQRPDLGIDGAGRRSWLRQLVPTYSNRGPPLVRVSERARAAMTRRRAAARLLARLSMDSSAPRLRGHNAPCNSRIVPQAHAYHPTHSTINPQVLHLAGSGGIRASQAAGIGFIGSALFPSIEGCAWRVILRWKARAQLG